MRYNKTAIENTIEKIFGAEVDDAELSELLQKIIAHREIIMPLQIFFHVIKARLEYEKGAIMQNNNSERNNYGK